MGKPKNFSELSIGQQASFEVVVTEKLHESFAELSGDRSPIHCDEKFSSSTKFGKRIGYAFLLTSLLSRLYGEYLPGGSSVCLRQEASFVKPYFISDKLKIVGKVSAKTESTKVVEISSEAYRKTSSGEELVFRGKGLVQVLFEKN